jgi:hypothetical protein
VVAQVLTKVRTHGSAPPEPIAQLALTARTPVAFAVLHLHSLLGLVPAADRPGFLFACWQRWSVGLRPAHRVWLRRWASLQAPALLALTDRLGEGELWSRYRQSVRLVIADPALPPSYSLYEHVHATQVRFGVPTDARSLAALVVRAG